MGATQNLINCHKCKKNRIENAKAFLFGRKTVLENKDLSYIYN